MGCFDDACIAHKGDGGFYVREPFRGGANDSIDRTFRCVDRANVEIERSAAFSARARDQRTRPAPAIIALTLYSMLPARARLFSGFAKSPRRSRKRPPPLALALVRCFSRSGCRWLASAHFRVARRDDPGDRLGQRCGFDRRWRAWHLHLSRHWPICARSCFGGRASGYSTGSFGESDF